MLNFHADVVLFVNCPHAVRQSFYAFYGHPRADLSLLVHASAKQVVFMGCYWLLLIHGNVF